MGEDDMDGPEPIPQDDGYWQAVAEDADLVPEAFASEPAPAVAPEPLAPQVATEALINMEAEAAVLGAAMLDNVLLRGPLAQVAPDDFAEPLHQRLWAAIRDMAATGKPATPVTLWPRFAKDPALNDIGGGGYLVGLTGNPAAVMGVAANATHLRDLAMRRRLAGAAQAAAHAFADPAGDINAAIDLLDRARRVEAVGGDDDILPVINSADWAATPPSARKWVVKGWLEPGALHLFGGEGGVGKSLFLQQLATAIATGREWLSLDIASPGPVLFVNAEDAPDEMHRRQWDIMRALHADWPEIAGKLHSVSLLGADSNDLMLGTFDGPRFRPGPAGLRLERTVAQSGAVAVFLDNRAQLFPGDLNDNAQVTSFCNWLSGIGLRTGAAVVLATHPAKSEGSEFAGAMAWENAVRQRWFLEREGEGGDFRTLTRGKANYAKKGEGLEMMWHNGAFIGRHEVPDAGGKSPREEAAETAFLACLDELDRQRQHVPPNLAGLRAKDLPQAKGFKKEELQAASVRLLAEGVLVADAVKPWRREGTRHAVYGLGRA